MITLHFSTHILTQFYNTPRISENEICKSFDQVITFVEELIFKGLKAGWFNFRN